MSPAAGAAGTIRALNDTLRTTFITGKVMLTEGIMALSDEDRAIVLDQVRGFNAFTPDNDPHDEHDFGTIDHKGTRFFWKIDYYAPDLERGSEDPADPGKTIRVLTIMRADEY